MYTNRSTHASITDAYTQNIIEKLKADQTLSPFMMTVCFTDFQNDENDRNHRIEDKIQHKWKQYDKFYRHLTSNLMTNFSHKRHLHPQTVDFIDVPGTRNNRPINLTDSANSASIHIHGIWLIHHDTLDAFNQLRNQSFKKITNHKSMMFIESVKADPIIQTKADVHCVVTYSSKILKYPQAIRLNEDVPLDCQYPISRSEVAESRSRKELINVENEFKKNESERMLQRQVNAKQDLNRVCDEINSELNSRVEKIVGNNVIYHVGHLHSLNTSNNHFGGIINV